MLVYLLSSRQVFPDYKSAFLSWDVTSHSYQWSLENPEYVGIGCLVFEPPTATKNKEDVSTMIVVPLVICVSITLKDNMIVQAESLKDLSSSELL